MLTRIHKPLLCAAAALLLCALLFSFSGAFDVPAIAPVRRAVFALESGRCISLSGQEREIPAPYIEDGVGYLPLAEAVDALGGEVTQDAVAYAGQQIPLSSLPIVRQQGTDYTEIRALCDALSLRLTNYGGLFAIGEGPVELSAEERDALRLSLGAETGAYVDRGVTEPTPEYAVDPYQKYSYDDLLADLDELEARYPALISVYTAGVSVEGREIPAFTLGRGERVIFYGAAIHAGEYITTNIIMHMADRYAYGYYAGEQLEGYLSYRELLDNVTFYIVPQINPDGVNIAQNGYSASTLPVYSYDRQGVTWPGAYKANANGVDLNRNFPYKWDPMQENGITWRCMRYFCGFEAASEPETQMLVHMGENLPFEMFADFHKFGEVLFWVDSDAMDHLERYGSIAQRMQQDLGYEDKGVETIDHFGGYLSNYMRNTYDRFSLTIETCRYWSMTESQFDDIDKNVFRVGLVMGEELLALPDEAQGLRAMVNGRTLPFTGTCAMTDGYISRDQLLEIGAACGVQITWDAAGVVTAQRDGAAAWAEATAGEIPAGGDLYAVDEGGRGVNVTQLLAPLGVGAERAGTTAYISFFH